jgi:hypothetical protein
MNAFALPKDGEIFVDQVLERCNNLIASGIWDGFSRVRLDTWMKNFQSALERYFGACILDALIFRSQKQTVALMEHLFERAIPDLQRQYPCSDGDFWLEALQRNTLGPDPHLRLIPVIKRSDPPAKSGPALARLYRRHLQIGQHWMIWPWQITWARQVGIKKFLFIDDFLGTGQQFSEFAEQFGLQHSLQGCYALYAPLVAHKRGIDHLKKTCPDLHVVSVEVIDDSYSVFSGNSLCFNDGLNTPLTARSFYDSLVQRAQFPVRPEALRGYGKLSLCYAFAHATPDNSLPIIWAEGPGWKPLLEP